MKLLKFIFSVTAVIIIADFLFGIVANFCVEKLHLKGDYESLDYVMTQSNDEAYVLGSSVALNSFVPTIFTDSTGVECYNAASNGQNMTFFETVCDCILKRSTPKLIVLGLRPTELAGKGIGDRFNLFAPYYGKGYEMVDQYMESKIWYEKYFLKSNLYRYNTIWWRIFLYYFITPGEPGEKGYIAKGIPMVKPELIHENMTSSYSEERVAQLTHIINMCESKGVNLVIYFPPMYSQLDYGGASLPPSVAKVKEICEEHKIPCFYDAQDPEFLEHVELFYDNIHLNKLGAPVYTNQLIEEMREAGINF